MKQNSLLRYLSPGDAVVLLFLGLLSIVNIVFARRVEAWLVNVLANLAAGATITALAWIAQRQHTPLSVGLHRWAIYPAVLFLYNESSFLGYPIHGQDYDNLLIAADRAMFGVDPTHWMYQFAHPALTEVLQLAYFSYYFLFIAAGVELFLRQRIEDFDEGSFVIVYAFCLSYIGYLALPAVGPRWHLHEFSSISKELPGLFFTEPIRAFLNGAEHIGAAVLAPPPGAHRNVFPSGHTLTTLVVATLGFRYKLKSRWILAVVIALLIISTVYLRYHYVIDLVAALLTYAFTLATAPALYKFWLRFRKGTLLQPDTSS